MHKVFVGNVRVGKSGLLYDVEHEGEVIVRGSTTPLLDACRALAERGLQGPVEMWDRVRPFPRMISTVEAGAALTIREGSAGAPRFVKWRARDAEGSVEAEEEMAG